MSKLKFNLTLLLACLLTAVPGSLWADLNYSYDEDAKTATVIAAAEGSAYEGAIEIPATVTKGETEYTVTAVASQAFSHAAITELTVPNTVTSMGADAASYCNSLAKVTLGSGITSLGQGVFYSSKLEEVVIKGAYTSLPGVPAYFITSKPACKANPVTIDAMNTSWKSLFSTITADEDCEITKEQLATFVQKYGNMTIETGSNPGQYSEEAATAMTNALAAVRALGDDATDAERGAAVAKLVNTAVNLETNPIVAGYYRLVNGADRADKQLMVATVNTTDNVLAWAILDETKADQIFKFEARDDGKWNLYNVGAKVYVGTPNGSYAETTNVSADTPDVNIFDQLVDDKFFWTNSHDYTSYYPKGYITNPFYTFRADADATATEGVLNGWGTRSDGWENNTHVNLWKLVSVPESEVKALVSPNLAALEESVAAADELAENCWYWKNWLGKGVMEFDNSGKQDQIIADGKGTLNGEEVGQIVSNALYAEFTAAIDEAKTAIDEENEDGAAALKTKLDSLMEVVNIADTYTQEQDAATLLNPLTEGYYVVMMGLADQCNGVIKVMGYDETAGKMVQQNYTENYAGQIFEVTKSENDGFWNFKNVAAKKYLGQANGTALELSDDAVDLTLKTHRPDWDYSKRVRLRFFVGDEATNWSSRASGDDINAASGYDWQLIWVLRKVEYTPQSDAVEALTKALAESDIAANYPFAYYDDNDQKTLVDGSNSCDGTELGQYLPNELRLNLIAAREAAQTAVDGGEVTEAQAQELAQAINDAVAAIQEANENLPAYKPAMGVEEVAIPMEDGGVYYIISGLADDQEGKYNKGMGVMDDGKLWRTQLDDKANPNFMFKFTKKTVFVTNPDDEDEEIEYTVWNVQNLGTGKFLGQHVTVEGDSRQQLELADEPLDYVITLTDNSVIQGGNQKKRKRFDFRAADWDMTKYQYGIVANTNVDDLKINLRQGDGWEWRTVWFFRPVPEDLIPDDTPVVLDTVRTYEDIDETKLYTITSKRGTLAIGPSKSWGGSTAILNTRLTKDAKNVDQQIAFVKVGDNWYMYSPEQKEVLRVNRGWAGAYNCSGTAAKMTFTATGNADYPVHIGLNAWHCNMQNSDSVKVTIDNWASFDDGNQYVIESVPNSEFDPTEAKAQIEELYTNFTKKVFIIRGERGGLTYNTESGIVAPTGNASDVNAYETLMTKGDDGLWQDENDNQKWAFVYNKGDLYLYNVGQKKFVVCNSDGTGTLAKNEGTKMSLSFGNNSNYPFMISDEFLHVVNNNNGGKIVINTYISADAGNRNAFDEFGDFDDTNALAQLNATRADVTYNLMTEDSVTFYSYTKDEVVGDDITELPEVLKNAYYEYGTVPALTVGADAAANVIDVVAKWVGPFEISESFDENATWYALNLRNSTIAIKGNEDGTTAVAINNTYSAADVLAGDIWAFKGDAFNGFSIYNKKCGMYMKAPADINNEAVSLNAEENADWTVVPSQCSDAFDGAGFMLQVKGDDPLNTLNQYGGSSSAILKVWHNANNFKDAGGAFQVQKPNDFVVDAIKVMTDAPEGAVYSLNEEAKTAAQQAIENADNMSLAELAEAYDAAVAGQIQPTTGFYRLVNKYYNENLGIDKDGKFAASTDDLSTIFKLTLNGDKVKLAAQGLEIPMMETSAATVGAEEGIEGDIVHTPGTVTAGFDFRGDGEHQYPTYCSMHMASNKTLVGWEPSADASQWYLIPVEEVTYPLNEIDGVFYATMYLPFGVEAGEDAEIFTIEDIQGDYAQLKVFEGTFVPAGTPVIVKSEAKALSLAPSLEDGEAVEGNLLEGTYLELPTPDNAMIFSGTPGEIGFYKNAKDAVPANKAYIVGAAGSNKYIIDFTKLTGINGAKVDFGTAVVYDLQGRRVEKPTKGIFIVNGKKVQLK